MHIQVCTYTFYKMQMPWMTISRFLTQIKQEYNPNRLFSFLLSLPKGIMFNKIFRTGKTLANIGVKTVSTVLKSTLENTNRDPKISQTTSKTIPDVSSISGMKNSILRQAAFKGKNLLPDHILRHAKKGSRWIPSLQFNIIGSGKSINLRNLNIPAVLFISHKENAEEAAQLNSKLILKFYPGHMPIFTGNIILLEEIPSFARSIVRRELKKAYETIIRDWLKDPALAEQWIHILPDWENKSIDSFHLANHRPLLSSVVLAPGGKLQAVIKSEDPIEAILQQLSPWISL